MGFNCVLSFGPRDWFTVDDALRKLPLQTLALGFNCVPKPSTRVFFQPVVNHLTVDPVFACFALGLVSECLAVR